MLLKEYALGPRFLEANPALDIDRLAQFHPPSTIDSGAKKKKAYSRTSPSSSKHFDSLRTGVTVVEASDTRRGRRFCSYGIRSGRKSKYDTIYSDYRKESTG